MEEKIRITVFTQEIEFEVPQRLEKDLYIPFKLKSPRKNKDLVLKITKGFNASLN
ncbi:MAG: hypothetical protein ACHQYP_10810 [Nitrospiria bacterium]|jgi:hypothetical protein